MPKAASKIELLKHQNAASKKWQEATQSYFSKMVKKALGSPKNNHIAKI